MLPLHSTHAPISPTGRHFGINSVAISHHANNVILKLTPKISEHKIPHPFIQECPWKVHCFPRLQSTCLGKLGEKTTKMQKKVLLKKPHIHSNSMAEQRLAGYYRGSAANLRLLRLSNIWPRLATFWRFCILRRYRRPPDHSQGLNYIILRCLIQRRCPFLVNLLCFKDLPGISIRRWCACVTGISHFFF